MDIVESVFLANSMSKGDILFISSAGETGFAPGREDSPPMSIISAPFSSNDRHGQLPCSLNYIFHHR